MTNDLPPKPEYGEYQTAEWDEGANYWLIRDLTSEEIIEKFPEPKPDPNYVPPRINIRQLRIGLTMANWISKAEAREWRKGISLPQPIQSVIDQLPSEQQFAAEETAFSMSHAYRDDPLLFNSAKIAMPEGSTDEEISSALDQAFRDWAKL